ncbi:MAG: TetR/AcrR family transcriptional regulator [Planctomycetota bacterium]
MTPPTEPSTDSPGRRRRKEARPQELVEAAMASFAANGFAGATVDDVARRAGVAKGTVYRYYETKEALFEAVVRHYVQPFDDEVRQLVDSNDGSAAELLTTILRGAYAVIVGDDRRRAIMRMLIAEGERFPQLTSLYYQQSIRGAEESLRRVLRRGAETGEFRRGPLIEQPHVVMGPAVQAAIWKMVFEQASPLDLERHAEAHIDLVLSGLLARPDEI